MFFARAREREGVVSSWFFVISCGNGFRSNIRIRQGVGLSSFNLGGGWSTDTKSRVLNVGRVGTQIWNKLQFSNTVEQQCVVLEMEKF